MIGLVEFPFARGINGISGILVKTITFGQRK
jgi:hypothetical protein